MLKFLEKAYNCLVFIGSLLKSPLLLLMRLYWGWLFFQAGLGKFQNIDQFVETLHGFNMFLPRLQAYLAASIELICGLCLIAGFASRFAAFMLSIVMVTAYATAHLDVLKVVFQDPSLFVAASPFNFLLTCVIVLAFGPGRFSLDFLLERWVFKKS